MAQISSGPVGILPGQNMFETDSTRQGILDARQSFVRMVNVLFERTAIAVERPDAVAALDVETPTGDASGYMIWRQSTGERHVETIPPKSEYDDQVYSIEERDSLLQDPTFIADIKTASRRVLVNGLANDVPQWSVWNAIAPFSNLDLDNPEIVFSLAKTYDFSVETKAERNLLTQSLDGDGGLAPQSRVLVAGDATTGGFWTIWEYLPGDVLADDAGFVLRRTQTYRTRDFWEFIDWFAEGYSLANPPVVKYATAAARNAAENPVPKTKFVRLDDDGNGKWVWTVFADGAWNIVAREKGTIKLSEKLYDKTRDIIFEPTSPTATTADQLRRVFNREGSWELRLLIDALRDGGAFTDLEINEVFFSMLHFVHAQQDQVSWAFKTSFLNIGGYNESLRPVPVQPVDNTQNLLDYIEEVKPYRVKTRDFTRVVTPDIDVIPAHVTDFDLPPYYDPLTAKHRILSISNAADLEIIRTQSPWKDWFENYEKTLLEPEYYEANTFNPVRHFNIRMDFDRVDHMPIIAEEFFVYRTGDPLYFDTQESMDSRLVEVFINRKRVKSAFVAAAGNRVNIFTQPSDGADIHVVIRVGLSYLLAGDRIQRFYDPNKAEKNLRAMLGLEQRIPTLSGGALSDNSLADYASKTLAGAGEEEINTTPHYGLMDPLRSANRPEELIVVGSSESLSIVVTGGESTPGGPEQVIATLDLSDRTGTENAENFTFSWGEMPAQSEEAVIVFRDGYRAIRGSEAEFFAEEADYFVTLADNTVTVRAGADDMPPIYNILKVRAFGQHPTARVHTQLTGPAANQTWTIANTTAPTVQTPTLDTIVEGWPAETADGVYSPTTNAVRLTPGEDYTVAGNQLVVTRPLDEMKGVIITTFSDANLFGMATTVFEANDEGQYPGGTVNETNTWSSIAGQYSTNLQGIADEVIDPEFTFEMVNVASSPSAINAYPVSISTDGRRAIFFGSHAPVCYVMDAATGAMITQYPSSKWVDDFNATHPNHGLTLFQWSSMDDLPGTNYVIVNGCYYDSGFVSVFMIYEIVDDGLVLYGSRVVPTAIASDMLAVGFGMDGEICIALALESLAFERPSLITLPKIDPINGDLWQTHFWNGNESTLDPDTQRRNSSSYDEYFMSTTYTNGRTGGRNGGGFIVPTTSGPRYYFYVSSGRIHYNLNSTNGRWDFAYDEGLTRPNGFMGYMDFNETTPRSRMVDPAVFDQNGPPFPDDRIDRSGNPETTPWPTMGVNGGQPNSSYTDQMQASPLIDGVYNSRFVVSFHKEYNRADDAPEGMAIKAVLFYFDPDTGTFEYFDYVEGDTVDTVAEYGFNNVSRYDYRKVGPTVFWARDTGDVWELFGQYDAGFITAAQIGKFTSEAVVIPTEEDVVFTRFSPVMGVSSDTFLVSMNRPATDLMAPKEVGDYDAKPLNDIAHDIGVVGGSEVVGNDGQSRSYGVGQEREILVARSDAWEYIRLSEAGGSLADPVSPEAEEIVILPRASGQMPFSLPTSERSAKNQKKAKKQKTIESKDEVTEPGVIWINEYRASTNAQGQPITVVVPGERIEFFKHRIDEESGNVILSELRRGTHGTRISSEKRSLARLSGNGTQKVFSLNGQNSVNGLEVVVYEGLKNADGSAIVFDFYSGHDIFIPKSVNVDYTAKIVNGNAVVTFLKAPPAGALVILGRTSGIEHAAGLPVHDGRNVFDIRPDRNLGGMVYY